MGVVGLVAFNVVVDLGELETGVEWVDLTACRELTAILAVVTLAFVLLLPVRYFMSRPSFLLGVEVGVGEARGEETCGVKEVFRTGSEVGGEGEERRFWFCLETRNDLGDIIL